MKQALFDSPLFLLLEQLIAIEQIQDTNQYLTPAADVLHKTDKSH